MKKILVTRNLLKLNEERVLKLFDAKLNKKAGVLAIAPATVTVLGIVIVPDPELVVIVPTFNVPSAII